MTTYNKLSPTDQQELLKFPVYISLLAANADGTTDDEEKNTAVAFEHTKTYSGNPILGDFYSKSEALFKENWCQLDNELPKGKIERDKELKVLIEKAAPILQKFDPDYQKAVHKSMLAFRDHVSRAHHNVLLDFIFPIPIKGINV
jgi:hypothetical protein